MGEHRVGQDAGGAGKTEQQPDQHRRQKTAPDQQNLHPHEGRQAADRHRQRTNAAPGKPFGQSPVTKVAGDHRHRQYQQGVGHPVAAEPRHVAQPGAGPQAGNRQVGRLGGNRPGGDAPEFAAGVNGGHPPKLFAQRLPRGLLVAPRDQEKYHNRGDQGQDAQRGKNPAPVGELQGGLHRGGGK